MTTTIGSMTAYVMDTDNEIYHRERMIQALSYIVRAAAPGWGEEVPFQLEPEEIDQLIALAKDVLLRMETYVDDTAKGGYIAWESEEILDALGSPGEYIHATRIIQEHPENYNLLLVRRVLAGLVKRLGENDPVLFRLRAFVHEHDAQPMAA